eukprot:3486667-Pyramimonas_sp.AAC.3
MKVCHYISGLHRWISLRHTEPGPQQHRTVAHTSLVRARPLVLTGKAVCVYRSVARRGGAHTLLHRQRGTI